MLCPSARLYPLRIACSAHKDKKGLDITGNSWVARKAPKRINPSSCISTCKHNPTCCERQNIVTKIWRRALYVILVWLDGATISRKNNLLSTGHMHSLCWSEHTVEFNRAWLDLVAKNLSTWRVTRKGSNQAPRLWTFSAQLNWAWNLLCSKMFKCQ